MVSIDNGSAAVAGNGHAASAVDGACFPMASQCNGAQPESDRKRKMTVLPLEVGTRVNCRWRDSKYHPVKVIERRKLSDGANDYEYYVHYTECENKCLISICLFAVIRVRVRIRAEFIFL